MNTAETLKQIDHLESVAREILQTTAILKKELSGGSEGSISKPALSQKQVDELLAKRRDRKLNGGHKKQINN